MSAKTDRLAVDGGMPVNAKPFPRWPSFDMSVMEDIERILETGGVNYWTGKLPGETRSVGMEFEEEWAKWCGAKYGLSTTNGTSALHTALAGLGIGPGDEVIVPSYTFIATSFSVCQAGAVPVFADVEKDSHTLDPKDVEAKISDRTRAIMPVHLYGVMANMGPILEIASKHKITVVEDCAQAHGGEWNGKRAGTISDVGAFSFCQSKHFTTGGEGGAVITDDEEVAWQCRSFRDHGYDVKERMRLLELEAKLPYIHNMVGFNYRMTEIQSAIGLRELARFDTWNLPARRRNGEYLTKRLAGVKQIRHLPLDTPERRNAFWMFPIVVDIDQLRQKDIATIVHAIEREGVPAGPVMWPQCYRERAYQEHNGFGRLRYPFEDPNAREEAVQYDKTYCANAAWLEDRTFFVPCHPVYEIEHMETIGLVIEKVLTAYAR
jgi:dTDP-4-amino-4,6-dideoxygalactose transaminase